MKTIIIGIALIGAFFANIICKIKKSFSKKNRHVYTLQKDPEDERDFKFCVSAPVQLPDKVDLSDKCSPIVNQGTLNSCTANAIGSGMFEYMWIKAGNVIKNFSRLFLYYNERNMEGTVKQDCGAYIRDGMKTLCNDGICTEPSWPYIIRKFSKKPDNICYEEAVNYKILSYNRVQGQNQIKQCLAQGNCIVAGIWVYESFESQEVASTGMVPMPESTEKNLGGHAVLIVGYDDTVQRFKLRNSWGNGWGDKGYFYIPYLVFDKLVMDMWTASDIA